jgi:hypothetical protein
MSTRTLPVSATGSLKRSFSSTTMSAALPISIEPVSFPSCISQAPSIV